MSKVTEAEIRETCRYLRRPLIERRFVQFCIREGEVPPPWLQERVLDAARAQGFVNTAPGAGDGDLLWTSPSGERRRLVLTPAGEGLCDPVSP
jgi:hypothetical protein